LQPSVDSATETDHVYHGLDESATRAKKIAAESADVARINLLHVYALYPIILQTHGKQYRIG